MHKVRNRGIGEFQPILALLRLVELYREGGQDEFFRGIQDWIATNPLGNVAHKLISTATLSIGGTSVKILVNTREDLWRAGGHGERDVLSDFLEEISESDTIWDIGANVGTYSLLAAQKGAIVTAFEPGDGAIRKLRTNADLNEVEVEVHEVALGAEDGTAVLSRERSGARSILHSSADGDIVTLVCGDSLDLRQPDVVKIDVEGAELDVIDGMKETLRKCRLCFVEADGLGTEEAIQSKLEEIGFLRSATYERSIFKFENMRKAPF